MANDWNDLEDTNLFKYFKDLDEIKDQYPTDVPLKITIAAGDDPETAGNRNKAKALREFLNYLPELAKYKPEYITTWYYMHDCKEIFELTIRLSINELEQIIYNSNRTDGSDLMFNVKE